MENEFYFKVPAQKADENVLVDGKFLMYMIDLAKSLNENKPRQEVAMNTFSKAFKTKVISLWSDCLAHGPKPWQNTENIIGEALNVDYPFAKEKLLVHADEIRELISLVQKATTYEELKYLDNGEKWSELRQPVSFLIALGNALRLIDFKHNRQDWNKEEEHNPEIKFTL